LIPLLWVYVDRIDRCESSINQSLIKHNPVFTRATIRYPIKPFSHQVFDRRAETGMQLVPLMKQDAFIGGLKRKDVLEDVLQLDQAREPFLLARCTSAKPRS
jgi:hypothetical protein